MTDQSGTEFGLDAMAVARAAGRITRLARRTPVMTSTVLNKLSGVKLYFKCEHLQQTGAFKIRGAANAVATLPVSKAPLGVATHSSGNHGAALSCAAASRGINCHVVAPAGAVSSKLENIRRYGGQLVECEPNQTAREAALAEVVSQTGATPVPPYDDPRVIAGQGTIALELLEQVPELDAIVIPVGGGGMLSGCALWATHKKPGIEIYGAEPLGADDTYRSLAEGRIVDDHHPNTICDGLRAKVGVLPFALVRRHVKGILRVEDQSSIDAMRLVMQTLKQVVEPSCGIGLAAVLGNPDKFADKRVGVVLSGGNVDLDLLPWASGGIPDPLKRAVNQ
ncbi:MAG: pyridoxal-phosphate dependent enzyme [Pseudomonadota bacterium]